jgi:hypothetical protein
LLSASRLAYRRHIFFFFGFHLCFRGFWEAAFIAKLDKKREKMTQESIHTPGSWETTSRPTDKDLAICCPGGGEIIAEVMSGNIADMNIMAASLDLLEALRKAAWFIENVNQNTPNKTELFFQTREAWRNAIEKAEGNLDHVLS